jgi:hypothetical protein
MKSIITIAALFAVSTLALAHTSGLNCNTITYSQDLKNISQGQTLTTPAKTPDSVTNWSAFLAPTLSKISAPGTLQAVSIYNYNGLPKADPIATSEKVKTCDISDEACDNAAIGEQLVRQVYNDGVTAGIFGSSHFIRLNYSFCTDTAE